MPINFGNPQLPRTVAALAAGITANNVVITPTMNQVTDTRFYGRPGDTVTVRIPKPVPVREYDLNNDRNEPIKMDRVQYSTQDLTAQANRIYSAVGLPEEEFDFSVVSNWAEIVSVQAKSLANAFEASARNLLDTAKYEYVKHIDITSQAIKDANELGQDAVFNALIDAQQALVRMGSPIAAGGTNVYALAGSSWASLLRKNQRLNLVKGTGDVQNAFNSAVIGNYAGITVVEDFGIKPDEMILYTKDAFNVWSHAPAIPQGAAGAQTTEGNLSLRWIVDYDTAYQVNRSVLSAYTGFGASEDFVEALDAGNNAVLSDERYFIRGAKLVLGTGTDVLPGNEQGEGAGAAADSFLAARFNGTAVKTSAPKGVFMDLTYQNIAEGHVAAGKPAVDSAPKDYAPAEVNEIVNGVEEADTPEGLDGE